MVEDLLSQWHANRGLTSSPAESVRLWGEGGRGPDTDGRLGKMPVVPLLGTGQNGSLAPPNRQSSSFAQYRTHIQRRRGGPRPRPDLRSSQTFLLFNNPPLFFASPPHLPDSPPVFPVLPRQRD